MRKQFSLTCLFAILLCVRAGFAADLSPFEITPAEPAVNEEFTVKLNLPNIQTYQWVPTATDANSQRLNPTDAGFADEILSTASIKIKPRKNTKYVIRVQVVPASTDVANAKLNLVFNDQKLAEAKVERAAPAAGTQPSPPETVISPPPAPTDAEKMSARLNAAKAWSLEVAKHQRTDDLVISVEFFESGLSKEREIIVESGGQTVTSRRSIKTIAQRPLLDAASLASAVKAAVAEVTADSDWEAHEAAWHGEKKKFLDDLVKKNFESVRLVPLFREFLDEWEAEVKRVDRNKYRQALIEMPLVITAVLLEYEKQHILAAMTSGGPARSSGSQSSTTTSRGSYAPSHAAVHHARIMSRIHMRHERRMARIGW